MPSGVVLPDDEELIQRLARWLADARSEAAASVSVETAGAPPAPRALETWPPPPVCAPANVRSPAPETASPNAEQDALFESAGPGLFRLVEEFTALRQDVKLQAKGARGLQDQVEKTLAGLHRAIETIESATVDSDESAAAAVREVLESVVDLDASFDRGRVAAESARARPIDPALVREGIDAEIAKLGAMKRWAIGPAAETLTQSIHERLTAAWGGALESQAEGYRMVQNRLRRLLAQHDVERIETVGEPADPETMTIVDAVDRPGAEPGTVLEELRPGYVWRGQILRYAEVRVARSAETETGIHDAGASHTNGRPPASDVI